MLSYPMLPCALQLHQTPLQANISILLHEDVLDEVVRHVGDVVLQLVLQAVPVVLQSGYLARACALADQVHVLVVRHLVRGLGG